MEGSGGILCPLRVDETGELWLEDVVKALNLGCLVVADAGLGTIEDAQKCLPTYAWPVAVRPYAACAAIDVDDVRRNGIRTVRTIGKSGTTGAAGSSQRPSISNSHFNPS